MAGKSMQQRINEAEPGAEVVVPAGSWPGGLVISKPIRLIGENGGAGTSVIDGEGERRCIVVDARQAEISFHCQNLLLVNGRGPQGGGLFLDGSVDASIADCTIENNVADYFGGGGIYAERGRVNIARCLIHDNTGHQGGGILTHKFARVSIVSSLVVRNSARLGGGICLKDKASLSCRGVTLADNSATEKGSQIYAHGTMNRAPEITLINTIVAGVEGDECLGNARKLPGRFIIRNSLVPPGAKGVAATEIGSGVLFGDADFIERELYELRGTSPARDCGDRSVLGPDERDVAGKAFGETIHLGANQQ